ncbi:MAG: hypothetical protein FWC92_03250 [Defluviitaleaceae bacterium]|nr:hypothetical protein [Defluviitaleaceae bacterium]
MNKLINVIDEQGNKLAPTYPRRAKYLIKHGRAQADGDNTIILLTPPKNMTATKHRSAFAAYLTEKKRAQKTITEHMRLFDVFEDTPPSADEIGIFCWGRPGAAYGSGGQIARWRFLDEFAAFCEAQETTGKADYAQPIFAAAIRTLIHDYFEGDAWHAVTKFKQEIVFIPQDAQILPQFLNGLSNDEFVTAFKALQKLAYGIYEGIEQGSPFEWGWPDWRGLGVYGINHNRVMRAIESLSYGELADDTLVMDKKDYFATDHNKPQDRAIMLLKGIAQHGFFIEGLDDKKAAAFTVSCPDSPNVMRVLQAYFRSRPNPEGCTKCTKDCTEQAHCWQTNYYRHAKLLSHRFVEACESADVHAPYSMADVGKAEFLARTDYLPESLRQTHYAIYHDACKVGIWTEPFYDMFSNAIVYAKGTWKKHKRLIFWDSNAIFVRFERVFSKHPEKIAELEARFPGIFAQKEAQGQRRCANCEPTCKHLYMGTVSYCDYSEFKFDKLSHDDAIFIYELFKLDNNIKL